MKPVCTEKYNWYKWQEDCDPLDDNPEELDTTSNTYEPLYVGDVLHLVKSKNLCQVVDINNPCSYMVKVKVLGLDRTRHRLISRWDIKKRDKFLTAVYKANAGTST